MAKLCLQVADLSMPTDPRSGAPTLRVCFRYSCQFNPASEQAPRAMSASFHIGWQEGASQPPRGGFQGRVSPAEGDCPSAVGDAGILDSEPGKTGLRDSDRGATSAGGLGQNAMTGAHNTTPPAGAEPDSHEKLLKSPQKSDRKQKCDSEDS